MKIKILAIAAATLAVGAITSEGQVYSLNIVGYVNSSIPTNGFALIANQLDVGDGTNGINQVLANANLVSDGIGVNNTTVYLWQQSVQGFLALQYYNAADANSWWSGTQAGFYDFGGNYTNPPVPPGSVIFMQNPNNTVSNLTVTTAGTVLKSTNIVTISPGFQMEALSAPTASSLVLSQNYVGVSSPDGSTNDVLYVWNPSVQGYLALQYYNASDANTWWSGTQAGFYDFGGNYTNFAPNPGTGFFIQRVANITTTWTNSFTY